MRKDLHRLIITLIILLTTLSGAEAQHSIISDAGPGQSSLKAFPNPFINDVTITYNVARSEVVQLGVYNLLGQQIKLISKAYQSPGRYRYTWDGRDRAAKSVSGGMYYVILKAGEDRQVVKIMKTR